MANRKCSRGFKKNTRTCRRKPGAKRKMKKRSSRRCSRGRTKSGRCKRKPGSKKRSKKRRKSKSKRRRNKRKVSTAVQALRRRCKKRPNYDCYSDPNCKLLVKSGKRKGSKRISCVPRSLAQKQPPTYQGPINLSMSRRIKM